MNTDECAPIFIVGVSRSGTGLLRSMLNAHPRIYLSYEASFYLGSERRKALSGTEWLERYFRTVQFAWLRLHPKEVLAKLPDPLPRERLHEAFRVIMQEQARRHGKPRYGDKTPRHASHLRQIFGDFSDARVIHIVRDPRATISSLTHMPWGPGSKLFATWYTARQLAALCPFRERIHEVHFERLIADPRREMEKILEFVGERWDDAVLDHSSRGSAEDVPPLPWLAGTRRARGDAQSGQRRSLPTSWVRIVERCLHGAMERYGYKPRPLDRDPSHVHLAWAVLSDLPKALGYLSRALPFQFQAMRRSPPPPALLQRRILRLNPSGWATYPGVEIPDSPPGKKADLRRVLRVLPRAPASR